LQGKGHRGRWAAGEARRGADRTRHVPEGGEAGACGKLAAIHSSCSIKLMERLITLRALV
jgi:hypothetical protein